MEEGKKDPSVSQLVKAKVFIARCSDGTYDATIEYNKAIPFGLLGQGENSQGSHR